MRTALSIDGNHGKSNNSLLCKVEPNPNPNLSRVGHQAPSGDPAQQAISGSPSQQSKVGQRRVGHQAPFGDPAQQAISGSPSQRLPPAGCRWIIL